MLDDEISAVIPRWLADSRLARVPRTSFYLLYMSSLHAGSVRIVPLSQLWRFLKQVTYCKNKGKCPMIKRKIREMLMDRKKQSWARIPGVLGTRARGNAFFF